MSATSKGSVGSEVLRRPPPPPPPAPALRRRPDGALYWAPPAAAARTTTTPTLGLIKPVVGADENVWGYYLNANADQLDATVLPLAGGTMTGPLISHARISVTGAPITTDNTVLCHHLAAGITGANVGGFVGSWNEVTGGYTGFYTDGAGNIVFGNADAGLGTVSGTRAAIGPDGSMQVYGALATAGAVTAGGPVTLPSDPTQPLQAASKQYVDGKSAAYLPLAGGTVTGNLTVQGVTNAVAGLAVGIDAGSAGSITVNGVKQSPKAIYLRTGGSNRWIVQCDAANETGSNAGSNFALSRYSDAGALLSNAMTIARSDGTTQFYGPLFLAADPAGPLGAATKQYVDAHSGAGGIADAPSDSKAYGRYNASWVQVAPIAAPSFTGNVSVAGLFTSNTGLIVNGGNITATAGNITATAGAVIVSGAAGTTRNLLMQTAGVNRFGLYLGPGAESGSNAGSGFGIGRYDDSGTQIDSPLIINRASALATFSAGITAATGNITATVGSVSAAGGVIAGGNGVTYPTVQINGSAGSDRQILLATSGKTRWSIAVNSVAEGGSNAGSDYTVNRFNDAGTYLGAALQINRATGLATVSNGITSLSGNITTSAGGNVSASGSVYGTSVFADNVGNFGLVSAGNIRAVRYTGVGGYLDALDISTGIRQWISFDGTTVQMQLGFAGELTILSGTATKPGGGSWIAASDARIKDVQGNYTTGLDAILELRPVRYRYRNNTGAPPEEGAPPQPEPDSQLYIGLIAQEAETVMPEIVTRSAGRIDGEQVDDLRSLDPSALTFALINAVQQLAARVEALEGAVLG